MVAPGKSHSLPWHLEVYDLGTLTPVNRFVLPERTTPFNDLRSVPDDRLHWVPEDSGLAYINHVDGNSDIWLQPIRGGSPQKLTSFRDAEISSFSWSGGNQVACVGSTKASVPVLVKLF
jgi:hypothetical protein